MATRKQIDNALKVLNEILRDSNYEFGYEDINLYYKYKGGVIRRNLFIHNTTKTNILEVIWAMQTAADIAKNKEE